MAAAVAVAVAPRELLKNLTPPSRPHPPLVALASNFLVPLSRSRINDPSHRIAIQYRLVTRLNVMVQVTCRFRRP